MRAWPIAATALGIAVILATQGVGTGQPGSNQPALAGLDARTQSFALAAAGVGDLEALPSSEELNGVIQRSCMICHNDQLRTGNFSLQGFDVAKASDQAENAEKIIRKLLLGMMPPPGIPRPGGDTLQYLVTTLETELDRVAAESPTTGTRRFQRMTVGEYRRAVRDLLGIEVEPSKWLPADAFLGSYDTWSDMQGLSSLVVEAYMTAAAEVARMAVGNPSATPATAFYPVHIELSQHAWSYVEGTPYGTRGGTAVRHTFPVDGMYVFGVDTQLGAGHASEDIDVSIDGEQVALLALPHGSGGSAIFGGAEGGIIETDPIFVRAGQRMVSAAFVRKNDGPYGDFLRPHEYSFVGGERGGSWANYGITNLRHLTEMQVKGPFNASTVSESAARQRVFTCYPSAPREELACAESIVRRLATAAYRRPVDEQDMKGIMSFFESARAEGGFDHGVMIALQAVLSSPAFVFRMEEVPAGVTVGENYALSDLDLASRLSFFLWGTVPDSELLGVAQAGQLSQDSVLEAQVRRMLADPRSEALATRFANQWLRLAAMDGKQPVPFWYPDFSLDLANSMRRESELFFDHLIREDKSFFELLTANYTFVNDRLARHYGIPYTGGADFQKVMYNDPYRVGILGHGSVAVLTSLANRTSPVKRGEWVMEVLLGSPPPPPPPNVPLLDETGDQVDGRFLTTRQRMEMHRRNPTCNSCHQFIDPIGLTLDHFDPTGRIRARENRVALDTRGQFYDGTYISTPGDLAQVLLKRPDPLLRNFTKNLMGFAIGRKIEYYDQPSIRAIARSAAENDYRISELVLGVVKSDQFRMRQADAVADDDDRRDRDDR
jgi:hypothetical protein